MAALEETHVRLIRSTLPALMLLAAVALVTAGLGAQAGPPRSPLVTDDQIPEGAPARMSDVIVSTLVGLAASGSSVPLRLSRPAGRLVLSITSNRNVIAVQSAQALRRGVRYRPTPDVLIDLVQVRCTDAEEGPALTCTRLAITTLAGLRIEPFNYIGRRRGSSQVDATFAPLLLENGFIVTASAADGTTWPVTVSAAEARRELLLGSATDIGAPYLR